MPKSKYSVTKQKGINGLWTHTVSGSKNRLKVLIASNFYLSYADLTILNHAEQFLFSKAKLCLRCAESFDRPKDDA